MLQSIVGKVLSSCAMTPPMLGVRSTRWTFVPLSARSSDACIPAIPPPMTRTGFNLCSSYPCEHRVDGTLVEFEAQLLLLEPHGEAEELGVVEDGDLKGPVSDR